MGMNLFDGSDEIDLSKIETDLGFARRYEHNKRRENMHKIEELKKKGLVEDSEESSSEDEEDDDEDVVGSSKNESKFVDALLMVKNRDPIIKEKDLKLFESEDEESEQQKDNGNKKEKPMYLKDVVAMHLIEEGPDFEEKETKKTYRQEQDEFREAFLSAVQEPCDDYGDLLMEKKKRKGGDEEGREDSNDVPRKLNEYFGEDEGLDENQMFLKNFFRNKMWIDKEKGNKPANDNLLEVSEDEEEIEKQEKFEAEYNFRYEEGAGDRVLGHARFTEGSVRKKTSARKIQRKSKEERMALAEYERKEELKHLKNLKKKEIGEMIDKIIDISGLREGATFALNGKFLEEDFDPEEYDKKMNETFNDDYYEDEDDFPVYGSEDDDDPDKPDFDKENEMLGLPKDWDVVVPGDGFATVREKVLKAKANKKEMESSGSDGHDGDEQKAEGKRKRKREISLREKILDKYWEDYHKLDYEGRIGDLKTRFKYVPVPSQRFGLNVAQILMTDDKELNQRVPLKKIAPYTEKEYIPVKSHHRKTRNKLVSQGMDLDVRRCSKGDIQTTSLEANKNEQDSVEVRELNGDAANKSRRRKRRERQAELKPSQGRLVAYGKIPAKSKNKKKHKTSV